MREKEYRASRLCRLLGNPVVYQIVVLLAEGESMTPTELARRTNRTVSTISNLLARLRMADLVRYETQGRRVRYWLKHRSETQRALQTMVKLALA